MLHRFSLTLTCTLLSFLSFGCDADNNGDDFAQCDPPSEASLLALPPLLSQAGLYRDISTEELEEGVWAYQPRFPLWTDGATKRRWFFIPEGEVVDTRDMDQWRFPQGTKLFKEFTREGVRVETRIFTKTGHDDEAWTASSYLWLEDQSEAYLMPEGGDNQLGTAHDVPSAAECSGCHGGRASRVLGFSAVQLAWESPEGFAKVSELKASGILPDSVPETLLLELSEHDREALGYLHANCSHCHNTTRPFSEGARCYNPEEDFDFSIPSSGIATLEEAPAYVTGIEEGVINPGNATRSEFIQLFSGLGGGPQMPALGSESIDPYGMALLTSWVDGL